MPRLVNAVPKYRKHRGTGQALVVLNGREHYLGRFGSPASRAEYNRLTGQWLAAQRTPLPTVEMRGGHTVVEVIVAFLKHARRHYRKHGELMSEYASIVHALKFVRPSYGRTLAAQFGPLALTAVRDKMIEAGLARTLINQHAGRIRRMFRWAASREMLDAGVHAALRTVAGLEAGRTDARETEPVEPVADEVVEATLPHLPPMVAVMVQLQRLLGCRPAEICIIRPIDLDRSGDVWKFSPESHKRQHRKGRAVLRTIFIGPRAQQLLAPYLFRDPADYCFVPAESERQRRDVASAARVVPMGCGTRSASASNNPLSVVSTLWRTTSSKWLRTSDSSISKILLLDPLPATLAIWQSPSLGRRCSPQNNSYQAEGLPKAICAIFRTLSRRDAGVRN